MDFTSWADWARALLGATVTHAMTLLIWKMVVKAATFSDPYERTGRHILLVPRRLVRPRMDVVGSQLRASTALRRFQGLPPTSPYLPDLVELDRSTRQLQAGRRIWTRIIPCALVLSSVTLGTWLGLQYMTSGPFSELPSLYHVLDATLGSMGWYDWNGGDCTSWTVLRGCEASAVPWWSGTESGLALGIAAGWLLAAWRLRRVATREKQAERVHKDAKKRLPDDVQAALNVLGSRQLNVDSDPVIDLRNTFLVGANLYGLNFNDADFRGADLTEAYLDSGSFENVWFDDAQMSGSILSDAEFDQATFLNTDLKNASWDGARFEDADLTGADLTGATLSNGESGVSVDLRRAGLAGANLTEADLTGADLRGANLSGAPDQGISAAKLVGTNFTDADLTGALLDGTDRQKATWNGAKLP
ncbi:pentapeptide repeat-containing protein [Streptomyces sp. NPDC002513]